MSGESLKMRQVFKRSNAVISLLLTILLVNILLGCEGFNFSDVDFGGDIYTQIKEELSVTYSFYEYPLDTAVHKDVVYIAGKTIKESEFPTFVHEDEFLVGWQYYFDISEGLPKLPSNFSINNKGYIGSFKAGITPEKLYAIWKTKRTVTFVTNNDLVVAPVVLPEGDCVVQPDIESRHGRFRFAGWYIDENFTEPYDFSWPVLDDIILYAKWVEFNTVKYYKNFGSNDCSTQEIDLDESYWVSDYMFDLRDAYGFVGWATSPEGDAVLYPGYRFDILETDLDLYAVWTTDLITITYIDTSGTFDSISSKFGKGAHVRIGQVINESKRWYDYLYSKWEIEGFEVKGYSASPDEDINSLSYDAWGGHTELQYDYNDNPVLDEYGNQQYIWTQYTKVTSDQTFYVYWGERDYWVYFRYIDQNGIENFFESQIVLWNHTAVRPDSVPHIPGYTFVDWYRASWDGRTQSYILEDEPFDFSTVFNKELLNGADGIELFAKFEPADTGEISATVTFEANPESDIIVTGPYDYGSYFRFEAPDGYVSYNWYLDGNVLTSEHSNILNLSKSTILTGWHDIVLIVYDGTDYYSWNGQLSI